MVKVWLWHSKPKSFHHLGHLHHIPVILESLPHLLLPTAEKVREKQDPENLCRKFRKLLFINLHKS